MRVMQKAAAGMPWSRKKDAIGLVLFLAACFAVSGVGGLVTASSVGDWYLGLSKPAFNPPNWLFAPVWTALYLLMAIAAWRVWRSPGSRFRRHALAVFWVQLGLNLLWSFLFFGFQQIGWALIEILILLSAIAYSGLQFWRIERLAGWLFVPYALWVAYAALLN